MSEDKDLAEFLEQEIMPSDFDVATKTWEAARDIDAKKINTLELLAALNKSTFDKTFDQLNDANDKIAELESHNKVMREALGMAQDELTHLSHHTREDYARNCANELFNNIEQALANVRGE